MSSKHPCYWWHTLHLGILENYMNFVNAHFLELNLLMLDIVAMESERIYHNNEKNISEDNNGL
jgi:hypothetical protein